MISIDKLCKYLFFYYELEIDKVEVIKRLLFRQSYFVTTFERKKYMVKDYAGNMPIEELSLICRYYWKLHENGVGVGCPIKAKKLDDFYISINNRYYVVFEYINGIAPTIYQYDLIVQCLKKYHQISANILLPGLKSTKSSIKSIKANFSFFEDGDYILKKNIFNIKENVYEIIDRYTESNSIIIHGDSILENMIVNSDEGEICLIDFDSIRYGDALEDLSNTILSVLYNGSEKYKLQKDRYELVKKMVCAYLGMDCFEEIKEKILYYMQLHCAIELNRHAENIRYLIRMPGMKDYLLMLIGILQANDFNELFLEAK